MFIIFAEKRKSSSITIIAIIVPIVIVAVVLVFVRFCFLRRKAKNKHRYVRGDSGKEFYGYTCVYIWKNLLKCNEFCNLKQLAKQIYCLVAVVRREMTTMDLQIDLVTIEAATNNFSEDNRIGEGGFGIVYKVKVGW